MLLPKKDLIQAEKGKVIIIMRNSGIAKVIFVKEGSYITSNFIKKSLVLYSMRVLNLVKLANYLFLLKTVPVNIKFIAQF